MAQLIRLPALSPTMEQGNVSKWYVNVGDTVTSGDLLADIETDKTTMEFEAIDEGVIAKILVPAGPDPVKVNEPIAVLVEDGEAMSDVDESTTGVENKIPNLQPEERQLEQASSSAIEDGSKTFHRHLSGLEHHQQTAKHQSVTTPEVLAVAPVQHAKAQQSLGTAENERRERIFASPLARRIAAEKNIDLESIEGSGPHGRIVKSDVLRATVQTKAPMPAPTLPVADVSAQFADREFTAVPLDGMRRTVAARLSEAKQTIPHFYLRRDFNIDTLLQIRASVNEALASQNIRVSINDFIIRACALALQSVPEANAIWADDQILRLRPSDVAVAVAIEGGLLTPVIRDAETKSVRELSVEMKALAAKAKSRKLMQNEYTGGTFSISNLGMFGVASFDAVINPPQASILAVGAAQRRAVEADDGAVKFSSMMPVTLSCDHRVIDGAVGAEFLGAIAENIETPLRMLV